MHNMYPVVRWAAVCLEVGDRMLGCCVACCCKQNELFLRSGIDIGLKREREREGIIILGRETGNYNSGCMLRTSTAASCSTLFRLRCVPRRLADSGGLLPRHPLPRGQC